MSAARYMAKSHTIIPAPARVVRIQPATKREVVSTIVDLTHAAASAGAVIVFLAGLILTNL